MITNRREMEEAVSPTIIYIGIRFALGHTYSSVP